MTPRALIFESGIAGHRLQNVRYLADALLEVGCAVTIALRSDAAQHDEYDVHMRGLEASADIQLRLLPDIGNSYRATWRRLQELDSTISATRPDWAYVPHADKVTQIGAVAQHVPGRGRVASGVPIEGQVMRASFAYPPQSTLDRGAGIIARRLLERSPWHITHVLDTLAFEQLSMAPIAGSHRLIPEPVEPLPQMSRIEARRALKIDEEGRYIAAIGGMNSRKGTDLLLGAFERASREPNDRLLLVGRLSTPMRDLISSRFGRLVDSDRVVVIDRYVSEFELGCALMASNVLAIPHPRQIGSSGTLVRAVAARRPVIASDFGWVGWATHTFELGTRIDVRNSEAFAGAITQQLGIADDWCESKRAEEFRHYHTMNNQKAHWLAGIGAGLGIDLGHLGHPIPWPDVPEEGRRDGDPIG